MTEQIRISVHKASDMAGYLVNMIKYPLYPKRGDKICVVKEIKWEETEPGMKFSERPIMVDETAAQQLIDSLWNCGLRPTNVKIEVGKLEATNNHLRDMRTIIFEKFLKIKNYDKDSA